MKLNFSTTFWIDLVFEYAEHDLGELVYDHYEEKGESPFRESAVKQLALQLLSALHFLHSRHIIHRDLKLSNLLYNHRGQLKLIDFGLARTAHTECYVNEYVTPHSKLTPNVTSLRYRSPEVLFRCDIYSSPIDLWAVGLIIAELLLGKPILNGRTEMDQIREMFLLMGYPNFEIWPALKDLEISFDKSYPFQYAKHDSTKQEPTKAFIDQLKNTISSTNGFFLILNLLQYNPSKRSTAAEALNSLYFSDHPVPINPKLMPTFRSKRNK